MILLPLVQPLHLPVLLGVPSLPLLVVVLPAQLVAVLCRNGVSVEAKGIPALLSARRLTHALLAVFGGHLASNTENDAKEK